MPTSPDQGQTPYLDALQEYGARDPALEEPLRDRHPRGELEPRRT